MYISYSYFYFLTKYCGILIICFKRSYHSVFYISCKVIVNFLFFSLRLKTAFWASNVSKINGVIFVIGMHAILEGITIHLLKRCFCFFLRRTFSWAHDTSYTNKTIYTPERILGGGYFLYESSRGTYPCSVFR